MSRRLNDKWVSTTSEEEFSEVRSICRFYREYLLDIRQIDRNVGIQETQFLLFKSTAGQVLLALAFGLVRRLHGRRNSDQGVSDKNLDFFSRISSKILSEILSRNLLAIRLEFFSQRRDSLKAP